MGSTSKASKKEANVFYHVYKRLFLIKNVFSVTFFLFFFPNVYYSYGLVRNTESHNAHVIVEDMGPVFLLVTGLDRSTPSRSFLATG